jgi:RNA polymerase sigma factor (sigma-70 family)
LADIAKSYGYDDVALHCRDIIVKAHLGIVPKIALRVVSKVAQRRFDSNVEHRYLVAEGNLGLVEAWRTFDPAKSMYSTHPNSWIKKRMYEYINLISAVVPRPRGEPVRFDRSINESLPEGRETWESKLTAKESERREQQAAESAIERMQDFAIARMHAIAREILSERELSVFLGRYSVPRVKFRILSVQFGVSTGMIQKIANRALRKVKKRMKDENET